MKLYLLQNDFDRIPARVVNQYQSIWLLNTLANEASKNRKMKILFVVLIALNYFTSYGQTIKYNTLSFAAPFYKDSTLKGIKEIITRKDVMGRYLLYNRRHFNKFGLTDTIQSYEKNTLSHFIYFVYKVDTIPKSFTEGLLDKFEVDYLKSRSSEYQNSFFNGDQIVLENKYLLTDSLIGMIRFCKGNLIDTIFTPRYFLIDTTSFSRSYSYDSSLNMIKLSTSINDQIVSLAFLTIDSLMLTKFEFDPDSVGKLVQSYFYSYNNEKRLVLKITTLDKNLFLLSNSYSYFHDGDTFIVKDVQSGSSIFDSLTVIQKFVNNRLVKYESYYIDELQNRCYIEYCYDINGRVIQSKEVKNEKLYQDLIFEYTHY